MPTDTFFRIDKDKQERIISAACDEFSKRIFSEASISNIIKKAGIPRGSYYQYFEDKSDLYFYIIKTVIVSKKMSYFKGIYTESSNIIDLLEKMYMASFKFAKDYPVYAKIGAKLYQSKEEIIQKFLDMAKESSMTVFGNLLKKDQEKGLIKKDLDIQRLSSFLTDVNTYVIGIRYMMNKVSEEEVIKEIKMFLNILKFGILEGGNKNE